MPRIIGSIIESCMSGNISLIYSGFLMSECVLFYAKYSIDRKKQVKHIGTYFGDSGTVEDVKKLGINIRKVDTTVIIIPKIYDFNNTLDTIALDAQEYFEQFGRKLQEQQE